MSKIPDEVPAANATFPIRTLVDGDEGGSPLVPGADEFKSTLVAA